MSERAKVVVHRRMAPYGQPEPEHSTDGSPCPCEPYSFDPNDPAESERVSRLIDQHERAMGSVQ